MERLERRADSLRRQIDEAHEATAPPRARQMDGVEAAARAAHDVFVQVTRQQMAAAEAGYQAPRPFASVSRGAAGDEHTGPGCEVCAAGRRMDAERDMQTAARDYDMAYR